MALLIKKDLDTLMAISTARLDTVQLPNGYKMASSPGSANRLLLAVINEDFVSCYKKLEEIHIQSFLSTATEEGLDLVGQAMSCKRNADELDEPFRLRISQYATVLEAANELAIKMTLLAIPGIQDANMQAFTHGTGSFSAFIITEGAVVSEDIISECREQLKDVVAYGTKYEITGPDLVPVELGVKLILLSGALAPENITSAVRNKLKTYVNSKNIGEELIINEIIQTVMSVSEDIYDMSIYQFAVNNVAVLISNQSCRWNERFIESSKPNSIMVM